jgi:hypothetical protein
MTYGVVKTGFDRKPLSAILADMEEANIATFGNGIIQTPQSPMGQINGLISEFIYQVWEVAEATYQSLNPDEAEGINLDRIGRLRGISRNGRSDDDYRLAITNQGSANIHLSSVLDEIRQLSGVEYVRVWENSRSFPDQYGIEGKSLAFAVIGGDNGLVADVIHRYTVAGIGLHGDMNVPINDGGFCRTISFIRPGIIDVIIYVTISTVSSSGCEPPTVEEVQAAIYQTLYYGNEGGLKNGDQILPDDIRRAISTLPGARMVSASFEFSEDDFLTSSNDQNYLVAFNRIIRVDPARVVVSYV